MTKPILNASPGSLRTAFEPVARHITDYPLDWKSTHEGILLLPYAASVSSLSWESSRTTSKRLLLSLLCTIRAVVTIFGAELRGTPWIVTFKILDRMNVAKVFQTSDPKFLCKILRTRKVLTVTFSCNIGWTLSMHSNKESKERLRAQNYWIHDIALYSNKINILARYYFLYYWIWENWHVVSRDIHCCIRNFVNIFYSMSSTKNGQHGDYFSFYMTVVRRLESLMVQLYKGM
jgi:hypothetical protein